MRVACASSGGGSMGSDGAKVARSRGSSSASTARSSMRSIVVEKGGAHLVNGVCGVVRRREARIWYGCVCGVVRECSMVKGCRVAG